MAGSCYINISPDLGLVYRVAWMVYWLCCSYFVWMYYDCHVIDSEDSASEDSRLYHLFDFRQHFGGYPFYFNFLRRFADYISIGNLCSNQHHFPVSIVHFWGNSVAQWNFAAAPSIIKLQPPWKKLFTKQAFLTIIEMDKSAAKNDWHCQSRGAGTRLRGDFYPQPFKPDTGHTGVGSERREKRNTLAHVPKLIWHWECAVFCPARK